MNKILSSILKEKYFLLTAGLLLVLFFYGNCSGRRVCNCKATDEWKPGEQRGARSSGSHYGRSGFYHK